MLCQSKYALIIWLNNVLGEIFLASETFRNGSNFSLGNRKVMPLVGIFDTSDDFNIGIGS